jgi:ABC-type multidrug transport system fused ATPase/permease subunit
MKNKGKNPNYAKEFDTKGFWMRLWALLEPSQDQIKRLIFFIMIEEAVRLVGPYILKLIIDAIANFQVEDISRIVLLVVGMFLANQAASFGSFLIDRNIFSILTSVEAYLSNNAHRTMVFLGLSYHEKENTGSKISKIQRGVDKINDLVGNIFWEVGPTILQITFTTIVLFVVNWKFGLVILIFVPIFIFLTMQINKRVYPLRRMRHDNYEKAFGMLAQNVININTVKSFVQEKREAEKFEKLRNKIRYDFLQEFGHVRRQNLKRNFVIDGGRLCIMLLGAYFVWKGMMTVGSLVFVYTISEKALISLFRISRLYDRIMESAEAVERLHELSQEKSEIENPKKGFKPKKITGLIQFDKVCFSYNGSKKKALDDVMLEINAGCTTALVGPSGGGKTTLVRMIYRHYDPQEGSIMLDGVDIRKYDLYAFRRHIAIVPQEVEIFNTSVRDNIAYAKPHASFAEVNAAAKIANCAEFIEQLSEGYETLVGERGVKLSGGQRQRVGIARAILANPDILIFDEATSSLDSYSERLIQEAMERVSRNRTVIIIAHRLSTIKKADKIVVLEKGRVVEQGSHFELASSGKGLYKKLLELQNMGDIE